jgi:TPR repeat protein
LSLINAQQSSETVEAGVGWLLKAAAQDLPEAQYTLGVCFDKGIGLGVDHDMAVGWYNHAAARGHVSATFNLAVHHEFGDEKLRDIAKARELYRIAAEQGHEGALDALIRLAPEVA